MPGGVEGEGSREPEKSKPKTSRERRDLAYATDRHIADLIFERANLTASRDGLARELDAARILHHQELMVAQGRITELCERNVSSEATNRNLAQNLETERFQRGLVGLIATAMTAIGGSLVSVYPISNWRHWAMRTLLVSGCLFMGYNSLTNLGPEVRQHGIKGMLRRFWAGQPS